jgi:group II intron reverse transcriptase/maturase
MGGRIGKKFPGSFMREEMQQVDDVLDKILMPENIRAAVKEVKENNGAPGIDQMPVDELNAYFALNESEIVRQISNKEYKPQPVRRVYIPKPNSDKKRPLGIPTVVDRVVQQMVARVLTYEYDPLFSTHSYGFRPNRDCHKAMTEALAYLNEGRTWIIDFDIEKYFDTVNHDKLISVLRENINDAVILHLIRAFLKAGVMDEGLVSPTEEGVPQGGPLSPVLSNVYLDKLDKEIEARGLAFVRYADDFVIFTRSRKSAERVMKSVSSWIERKLFLKVSPSKTHIVPPSRSEFLGFGFWKSGSEWKCKPLASRKARLWDKIRAATCRRKAAAIPLSVTITKVNQILRGWINYYRIGNMKGFMAETGAWVRHRIRVIIVKQWKKPKTIMKNLRWYCNAFGYNVSDEDLFKVANSRKGLYAQCNGDVINYILSPKVLGMKITIGKGKNMRTVYPGLVDPLAYYLGKT